VHLLGLAMLYGLTGLLFTFTGYPGWVRGVLGPLPLLAQVADIGFWWLARTDPAYAQAVIVSGAAVGLGVALQILLSLFSMFGRAGKLVVVLLLLSGCVGGLVVKDRVIDPYPAREAPGVTEAR
jgi:hypothetical protein